MKQFIVLAVVLLAVQSIHATETVDELCKCRDSFSSMTKDAIIGKLITCIDDAAINEKKFADLTTRRTQLINERNALNAENCSLLEKLQIEKLARAAADKLLKDAQDISAKLKLEIADLEKRLADLISQCNQCDKNLTDCKTENARLLCLINELNVQIKQLESDLKQCRIDEEILKNKLIDCNNRLAACTSQLKSCRDNEATLTIKITELKAQLLALQQSNAACESALSTMKCDASIFLAAAKGELTITNAAIQSASTQSTNQSASYGSFISSKQLTCPCAA